MSKPLPVFKSLLFIPLITPPNDEDPERLKVAVFPAAMRISLVPDTEVPFIRISPVVVLVVLRLSFRVIFPP